MPYTAQLSPGVLTPLVQNQVYALPARACVVTCTGDIDLSNDIAFSTNSTLAKNTSGVVASAFVRCTAITNALIVCEHY